MSSTKVTKLSGRLTNDMFISREDATYIVIRNENIGKTSLCFFYISPDDVVYSPREYHHVSDGCFEYKYQDEWSSPSEPWDNWHWFLYILNFEG